MRKFSEFLDFRQFFSGILCYSPVISRNLGYSADAF